MNAEGKDKPEPGSIGEGLPPRILDLVLKSGAVFEGQLAGDVIEALAIHRRSSADGQSAALTGRLQRGVRGQWNGAT